ncbi:Golgi apparatus membrane protein TVP38 [Armillaria luteobubalina]|uniref:Golgi apparatus membrane protein TVP38 n=1 Tax=Armillaria luteobubalina TaxID=153913 RepID=A0AA39PM83_9AGAR|nr:Golgi apparatus membrane protein TVP38 [Armillaria luteobubalina]
MTTKAPSGWVASSSQLIKLTLKTVLHRYRNLHVYGKVFIWLLMLFYLCLGAFIVVVSPSRIAQFLYDQASRLSHMRLGWLILTGAIVGVSFPPLIGHSTLLTLCGFAFGMKGFAIGVGGSLVGSAVVFVLLRLCFSSRLRKWSSHNEKWQALESVVRAKGLPLIILIRVSPFPPWVYSNSLFASIEAVSLWQFVVATCFIFPKILLLVVIGSRIAALSDGDSRSHMDTHTKVMNGSLIGGGIIVAIFTSWLVYTLVQNHIRQLEDISPEVDRMAAEAIEEYDEDAPLLRSTEADDQV